MKRYFITGTDTDSGKTYVTSALLDYFPNSAAIKPVASGCIEVDEHLISSDAQQIQKTRGLSLEQINPWRFKSPVSPHIAAREEGVELSAQEIADYCLGFRLLNPDDNILFIEGAGGLLVPLNETETWLDFLLISEIPVILVVGMKLGCINHALLTEAVLKTNGVSCVGWIANCLDNHMDALRENIDTLTNKLELPLLAIIPFGGASCNSEFFLRIDKLYE